MENTVNERIKLLRNTLQLSQTEFAGKTGMSSPGVWKLEQGETKPRSSTLVNIANTFGVDKDWLIEGKGELTFKDVPEAKPTSSWKDEAYRRLEEQKEHLTNEVKFLRELLLNMSKGKVSENFLNAFVKAGILPERNIGESVRAAA